MTWDPDATQPLPPMPPGPAPSLPPPPPRRPSTGPGGTGGGMTMAAIVGIVLIVVSIVAVGGAVAVLGLPDRPASTPVALVPTQQPSTSTQGDPTPAATDAPSPAADPSAATPAASSDPEPGGVEPTSTPSPIVRLPKLSADITGATSIRYYAINGDTAIELIRQMERKGPRRCEDEALACVRLTVTPHVAYTVSLATGACRITGASPTLTAAVELPRWAKPPRVDRRLLAWWREVFDHITWHEGRHIQIEQAWMRKLGGMLEGKPCSRAAAIIGRWARKRAAAQAAFDAKDRATWTYPPFPASG